MARMLAGSVQNLIWESAGHDGGGSVQVNSARSDVTNVTARAAERGSPPIVRFSLRVTQVLLDLGTVLQGGAFRA